MKWNTQILRVPDSEPLINSDPNLDEVQRLAAGDASKSAEELDADAQTTAAAANKQSQRPSKDDNTDETVQDAVQRVLDKGRKTQKDDSQPSDEDAAKAPEGETEDTEEQENTQKEDTEHQDETDEQRAEREQKEAKAQADAAADAKLTQEQRDAKLPFHKHPRFVELTTENRALKTRQLAIDKDIQWRQQAGVDPDTYAQAMNLAAVFKKDPKVFFETVSKMQEEFEVSTGGRLPKDLQQKVTDGKMDEADARELAQVRLEKNGATRQLKTFEQRQAEDLRNQVDQALTSWGNVTSKNDPTFRPKAMLGTDVDGVYEYSMQAYLLASAKTPPKSGLEAQQLYETCYKAVKKSFAAAQPPRRPANRTLPQRSMASRGVTPSSARVEPENARDAVSQMLKKKYGTGLAVHNGE